MNYGRIVKQYSLRRYSAPPFSHRHVRFFVEILLATTDYDRFFFLMVGEATRIRQEENDREGGGEAPSGSSHK